MSHLRGGLDDDAVVGVAHAGHEGSVDLERMHWQIAQVTERGMPVPKSSMEMTTGLVDFLDKRAARGRVHHHGASVISTRVMR
jgi:hypothetical protein